MSSTASVSASTGRIRCLQTGLQECAQGHLRAGAAVQYRAEGVGAVLADKGELSSEQHRTAAADKRQGQQGAHSAAHDARAACLGESVYGGLRRGN